MKPGHSSSPLGNLSKKIRSIRFFFEFFAVIAAYFLLRIMPLGTVRALASLCGWAFFLIPPMKKLIIANIKTAFPEKPDCEIRKIASANSKNIFLMALEFLWFAGRAEKLDAMMDFDPEYTLTTREAKESGRGLIWVTPHLGNWELAGFQIPRMTQIPFAVVVRRQNNPFIHKLIKKSRESCGMIIIEEKGAVKGMLNALKKGFLLGTLIDQNTKARDGGIFVNFFGLPVATSRAPAFFARKLNVEVAVGGCVRKDGGYMVFAEKLPKKAAEYSSDEEMIQELMNITERMIRKYPEQYLWLYKRWQHIPENIPCELEKKYPFYSGKVSPRFYNNNAPSAP